ncbi:RNA-directed DNA polymerase, eukaryota, reverse transcriptase zinc-binding domain protein [Tanacetum coccineum]
MVLKQRYPRLYALEVKKTVDVASKLSQENLTWSFRRAPRSGVEQDQLTDLTTYVEGVVLGVTPDRWYWTLDGSGEFSVASARKVIDDNRFPEVSTQTRWIKAVPIKVNIHAWKVRMDCLPTRLNISRRGIDIPSILCPVCGSVTESSSHLFFDCLVAKDNFRKICRWWEVDFMEVHTFDEWVSWIVNLRIPIKHKRLLEGVFDTERLVNNLCTGWVGRHKLHANIPRFQREPLNKHSNLHNNFGEKRGSLGVGNNKNGGLSNPKGFMVFDQVRKANGNFDRHPSYVGVVKQKMMFQQTRDDDNKPSIVLDDSCVLQCDYSLSLTGKVLDFGSLSNLKRRRDKRETSRYEDTFDDELEDNMESKRRDDINDDDDVLIYDNPFKIYDLLEKQKLQGNNVEDEISNGSLNYPPGFTPIEEGDKKFDKVDKLNGKEQGYTENANEQVNNVEEKSNKGMSSSKEEDKESRCSGHFRRVEGPKTGGSILQLLDDVVKVGQTMGYKMDGCVSNIEEIIKSRGILCVWDPRMFRKQNSTVSDYFVAIQGVWIPNARKCLIISVYAPQEVSEKKMLWSYLNHVIG